MPRLKCQYEKLYANEGVICSQELTELNGVIHYFATMVTSQQEQVDRIEDNVEQAQTNVEEGVQELGAVSSYKPS